MISRQKCMASRSSFSSIHMMMSSFQHNVYMDLSVQTPTYVVQMSWISYPYCPRIGLFMLYIGPYIYISKVSYIFPSDIPHIPRCLRYPPSKLSQISDICPSGIQIFSINIFNINTISLISVWSQFHPQGSHHMISKLFKKSYLNANTDFQIILPLVNAGLTYLQLPFEKI